MLHEFVNNYVRSKNIIITSSAGGGATSLCLFIANLLLKDQNIIVYFNPQDNIERTFVRSYYLRVYDDVIFVACEIEKLLYFIKYLNYKIDYLILDPADCLLYNSNILPSIANALSGNIICSSQIRQDPTQGGKVYSTLEEKYMNTGLFNYSIWIRNITEPNGIFKRKYIDIFDKKRSGSNNISRYIANFTNEGNIIT